MIIEFQFTRDDYCKAFRAHIKKGASVVTRWILRLCIPFGALLLLGAISFVINGQRALDVVLPPLIIGALWIWIGMGWTYWLSARNQYAKNPSLRQPRRVEINGDGVKIDAGIASSQHSWQAYVRYVEAKDSFLLYTSPTSFNIIPKRVLQPEQVNELRETLKSNIGRQAAVAVS